MFPSLPPCAPSASSGSSAPAAPPSSPTPPGLAPIADAASHQDDTRTYPAQACAPAFDREACCQLWQSDVAHLRWQFAALPPSSTQRAALRSAAVMPAGKIAAFLEPLLARDPAGRALVGEHEQLALREVILLPADRIGIDLLRDAGLSEEAAHDLCDLLQEAPEDAIMEALVEFGASPSPLATWWAQAATSVDDVGARDACRALRVLQLAGYRQWPFDEPIWRGAVMLAARALRLDPVSGEPRNPFLGRALLDLLPRNPQAQRLMTTFTGEPVLLFAMRHGMPAAAVDIMLSLGFDPNVPSPHACAVAGDAVPVLPEARALHYAAIHGDISTLGLLACHGVDVNARDARGYPPILYAKAGAATLHGGNPSTIVRIAGRTDPRLRDDTAAVVRMLLSLGADPRLCGRDGLSVGRALVLSVMAARDGGGRAHWPAFEALVVKLCDLGVRFDTPHGCGVPEVMAFAASHAADRPDDAIWSLGELLRKLSAW
ncbi:Ankyrin repeats (3 copies) [Pandoraea pnomenusa]|uniref:Ankyrin repeats (3 copies) n=1 Tax=Pandoraea pnomenusa TaxID=93220 RepID=A0A378YXJ3_9BURK|nr:ankyrin repeat domain-containing protein [Pandoraea pnomenusa]SUA81523.1 Ankyrin repeats (3 copies) [Pandoraea pnomenusa]